MQRMAFRAQTVLLDALIAASAFTVAYLIAPPRLHALAANGLPSLTLVQLVVLYTVLAGSFSLLFRRELSPWRYASIPDAVVLARVAVLTAGVFLLWVFVIDRARSVPRTTLF